MKVWKRSVNRDVLKDAIETFRTHFRDRFKGKVKNATTNYTNFTRQEILDGNIENLNIQRLKADTPHKAYPVNDRPRGQKDISSIKYHIKAFKDGKSKVSPIVMVKKGEEMILLDGMHRLVAAFITKQSKIRALIIKLD